MKILIAYASAGVGHKKAGEAIYNALIGYKDVDTSIIDVLDYTNPFFKSSYPKVYLFLINTAPFLWGFLYYFFDNKLVDIIFSPLRRAFHNIQAKRFIDYVLKEKPDVVLCTHFIPAEIVSGLKNKGLFKGKLVTVITDFMPHSFWLSGYSDYFIAAIEKTKAELLKRGVSEHKICVMGIPTDPKFSVKKGRENLTAKLGLENACFNVLIMGGGFGTGPVKEIVKSIIKLEVEIQVNVVCGENDKLRRELDNLKPNQKVKLNIFGYQNNIDEFMEVSDCIVTKSGGLTVSEALSKELPMIIIKPIPGQETKNCEALTGYGAAVHANTVSEIKEYIEGFINNPEKIKNMRTRIGMLAYPDSAKQIGEFVLKGQQ